MVNELAKRKNISKKKAASVIVLDDFFGSLKKIGSSALGRLS